MSPMCPPARYSARPAVYVEEAVPGRRPYRRCGRKEVVPASELTAALKQVRELQHLLGKKTMEFEILKEAVE